MINVIANLILRYRFEPISSPGEDAGATRKRYMQTYDGLTLKPENADIRFVRR